VGRRFFVAERFPISTSGEISVKRILRILFFSAIVLSIAVSAAPSAPILHLASMTSADDTGLPDYLAPEFLRDGGGEPTFDPVTIKGKTSKEAFPSIANKGTPFASRDDKSGTHVLELDLWEKYGCGQPQKEGWYIQTDQGMLYTINIAAEKEGYTVTGRGSFIKYEDNRKANPPLVILVEGDEALLNEHSVIDVNPVIGDHPHFDLASQFPDRMPSRKVPKMIGEFGLLGKPLFAPNAK